MATGDLNILFGGDTSFGMDCGWMFRGVEDLLQSADLRMLQLEEPKLRRETEAAGPDRTTAALAPLVGRADLLTLAGNHLYDLGEQGVRDTVDWCRRNGIPCCGGGSDAEAAEAPAFLEKNGLRVGVLAWNAVGPKSCFAGPGKGGSAGLDFVRAYVPLEEGDPGRLENDVWSLKEPVRLSGSFRGRNFPEPAALERMARRIRETREECDILIVYFHKGLVHQVARLGDYERLLGHLAVDSGADAVVATHAHLLRGVELYKGRAIYHGLNNFIMWAPQLSPAYRGEVKDTETSHNGEWVKKRVERFGFVPDPEYPTYPFHPDSVHCACARFLIREGRAAEYRLVPMQVEKDGAPYVHGSDPKGRETLEYLRRITAQAGLNARYRWAGDELLIE